MSIVGYARVSSIGQSLDIQREQLLAAGCERVFEEKMSGTTTEGRERLEEALRYVREGDVFMVCRLDHLARSMIDLRKIVDDLTARGVGFRALQQGAIDTTRSDGRLLLNILGSFAEFETDRDLDVRSDDGDDAGFQLEPDAGFGAVEAGPTGRRWRPSNRNIFLFSTVAVIVVSDTSRMPLGNCCPKFRGFSISNSKGRGRFDPKLRDCCDRFAKPSSPTYHRQVTTYRTVGNMSR